MNPMNYKISYHMPIDVSYSGIGLFTNLISLILSVWNSNAFQIKPMKNPIGKIMQKSISNEYNTVISRYSSTVP